VATFDKVIPPGGEGKITLRIKTDKYQGSIQKTSSVYSNDPKKKVIKLTIKGLVKVPIYVSPHYIALYGKEGQNVTRVVEVSAKLDKPLKLIPVEFNLAEKLTYTIEEIEKGKSFKIKFTSTPSSNQPFRGFLKLKTNYPEKPEFTIWIRGWIQKKIAPKVKS